MNKYWLIGAIVFVLVVGVIQYPQIRKTKPVSKHTLAPDGRLFTPPLSYPVPTTKDMMDCTGCHIK